MIKRNIKTPKVFTLGIIKPLSDIIPTNKNKIIYCEGLCKLFNIQDKNDKKYIIDVANKYFIPNQSLKDFKINQINIINGIFNEKKNVKLKDFDEIENELKKFDVDYVKNIFNKFDIEKTGNVTFNEMCFCIDEIGMNIKKNYYYLQNQMNLIKWIILKF